MATQLIAERFGFSGGKVRRDGPSPVIEGVLLCGPQSANRRRYRVEAFAGERVKLYDGRIVFLNHGKGSEAHGRDYQDKIAVVENARHRADGMPLGDLAVNPKHPYAETFLWDAEHQPKSCGMSHVARCQTEPGADGWEDVTEILEALSVDVVVDPATTQGLYESKSDEWISDKIRTLMHEGYEQDQAIAIAYHMAGRSRKDAKNHKRRESRRERVESRVRQPEGVAVFTWKQLSEWVIRSPRSTIKTIERAKRIAEQVGMDEPALPAEPAADADPDETVTAGLKQAGHAAWDACLAGEMTLQELISKLKDLLKDHDKYSGGGEAPGGGGEETAPESRSGTLRPVVDPWDVLRECTAAGLTSPSGPLLRMLSRCPDVEERAAFIREERSRAHPAEKPRSAGRGDGTGGVPSREPEAITWAD